MKKLISITAIFAMMLSVTVTAQVLPQRLTGFSDFKLYLDPGHSGFSNAGYGGYSESEKNLDVAFYIKEFLMLLTDMPAENFMFSRTTHSQPELAFQTKADQAYAFGAHMYFSPHSDAPSVTATSTVMLYGGRRLAPGLPAIEKLPEGGKRLGELLVADMTSAMRVIGNDGVVRSVGTRGNINDLVFFNNPSTVPHFAIHRLTNNRTASILTEAGFHTNPIQNMQFTNREHRRMQGYTNAQSIIRWWTERETGAAIEPPQLGIATGFVFDSETARFINGATITVTEPGQAPQVYVTDTWESLQAFLATLITVGPAGQIRPPFTFREDRFGNGFWWIEGFTPGATLDVKVEAEGFETVTTQVTIPMTAGAITNDGLGIADISMLNLVPSRVAEVITRNDLSGNVLQRYPLDIHFTRRMDRASVEAAFSIEAESQTRSTPNVTLSWLNDFTLRVNISELEFETTYTITIDGAVAVNTQTNQFFDGTGDSTEGGVYVFSFTTAEFRVEPPRVVSFDPQGAQEIHSRPIVRIEFDDLLNEATTIGKITVRCENGELVPGVQSYYGTVNFRSVLHFIFNEDLLPEETYTVTLAAGIECMLGNAIEEDFVFTFTARPRQMTSVATLANFNGSLDPSWWDLTGSGSTTGVVTTPPPAPTRAVGTTDVRARTDMIGSVRAFYQWQSETGTALIRWHLNAPSLHPIQSATQTLQYYVFGDGSGTRVNVALRQANAGPIQGHELVTLYWVGWRLITWDIANDPFSNFLVAGEPTIRPNTHISCFLIYPALPERSTEQSAIYFARLQRMIMGDFIERERHILTFGTVCDNVNGTVTAATAGGTLLSIGEQVPDGRNIHFTAVPNPGFRVKQWLVDGLPVTTLGTRAAGNTFTLTNLSANTSVMVEFEDDGTTGLCNIAFANLQIHPNPFVSEVTITGAQNSVLEIVNVLGTVVHTQPIHNSTETIQLEQLSSGIYFFRLSRDGQSRTLQVVKR